MTIKRNKLTNFLLATAAVLLLAHTATFAQPGERIDPRHPSVAYLQEWGYMVGSGLKCKPTWGEEFGRSIIPLGDVNGDAIADFLIERMRCDSAFGDNGMKQGNELLLYYGVKGKLPATSSGQRIGISEVGSVIRYLCFGDFNNDHYNDLVVRCQIYGDTSAGNIMTSRGQYDVASVVVFWNDGNGKYSLADTSRLLCDAQMWLGPRQALAVDISGDGINDLLLRGVGGGFSNGKVSKIPEWYIYKGNNNRKWNKDEGCEYIMQRWWQSPSSTRIEYWDHDCDGTADLILHNNEQAVEKVSILYLSRGHSFLDTNDIESIDTWQANGRFILFQDVTGDAVKEMVMIGGDFSNGRIKVFAGKPGQRLLEQYGDGRDSADRANARFPLRPWAQIMLPNALHDGWFGSEHVLFDLGDINNDGTSEIVAHADPYIIIYTTGRTLDSLIDILYNIPDESWGTLRRLGDIDGSSQISYGATWQGRVHFLKAPPKDEIPTYGGRLRSLPHPVGFRCEAALGVEQYQAPEPHSPSQQIEFTQQQTIPVPPTTVTGAQQ